MVYDSSREVTVLFGGHTKGDQRNGETWEWDGRRWTLVADTGPTPRYGHAMTYDQDRHVTVLHGGYAQDAGISDMWEWDGVEWRERQVEGPSLRFGHTMTYDTDRDRAVLFGGWDEHGAHLGDTWEFDPCVGLSKLKARCKGDDGKRHKVKATVRTSLPEGSTVPVDNTDLANNTTDRQRITVNDRGKAKTTWRRQHGQHTLTAVDCPRLRQSVACDPRKGVRMTRRAAKQPLRAIDRCASAPALLPESS
jgi:hypothetical protein